MLKFSILIIPIFFGTISGFLFNFLENEEDIFLSEKNITTLDSKTVNNIFSEKFIENYEVSDNLTIFESQNFLNSPLKYISPKWKINFTKKKIDFIEIMLPLIAYENQKILLERTRLFDIKNYLEIEKTLESNDLDYLLTLSKKYKVSSTHKHKIDLINEMLIKVNIIPNSIVLAQAANESGWGTSRFAKEYNALFGQYTYDENNGIVPFKREEGEKHLIKHFPSINKSIESYFININSHYAYREFRETRSKFKNQNLKFHINKLTQTLRVYAQDKSYVQTLNSIIKTNKLDQFDFKLAFFIRS